MAKIFNLVGTPDTNLVRVMHNSGEPNSLKIDIEGSNTLGSLYAMDHPVYTVTLGGSEPKEITLDTPALFINSICDCDTSANALHLASDLLKKYPIPVINQPNAILQTSRDAIYQKLYQLDPKLIVPFTVKLTPTRLSDVIDALSEHKIAFPFIFRGAGSHGGSDMLLIENTEEITKLEAFAFDGQNFYISAFSDYQSPDGNYRKARIIVVDGEAYARHLIIADHWKVHGESRSKLMTDNMALQQEEEDFVNSLSDEHKAIFRKIHAVIGLDYFGIDCHFNEKGEIIIFEINACMRFYFSKTHDPSVGYEYLRPNSIAIKEALENLFTKKLNA